MISSRLKASRMLEKYSETDAIIQATQCLVSARPSQKSYWWEVIEKIKYNGQRHDSI